MFEITFGLEILAFFTGLIYYKQINPVIYRLLIPFLLITVLNEGFSHYGLYTKLGLRKVIFYNVFFFVEMLVVGIIYLSVLGKRKLLFGSVFTLINVVAIVLLIKNDIQKISPDYISVICITLIVFGICYLYDLYISNKKLRLKGDPLFWFTIGLIVAQFLLFFFINAKRIESFKNDKSSLMIFRLFNTIGNIFYYLCICYSFICTSLFQRRVGT